MNCYAFIHLMEHVAEEVCNRTGQRVRVGRYVDESDSFHIYGKRIADFEKRFLGNLISRDFSRRTFSRKDALPLLEERRQKLREASDIS
jgi:hypothetical protein